MRKFLKKTIFFLLLPPVLIGIMEAFVLPPNFFTYRSWEALIYKNPIPHMGGFYPNMHIEMTELGDLAPHSKYAVPKRNVQWVTDQLGFRNETFIEEPDVLFIGDSFTAGVTLSQDETITSRVSAILGNKKKVYNMAPSSFGNFSFFYKNGIIKKPKLIIFSIVERLAPAILTVTQEENDPRQRNLRKFNRMLVFKGINTAVDRMLAFNSLKWATARVKNVSRTGAQSPIDSTIFFMQGKLQKRYTIKDAEHTATTILSYKKFCDSLGVQFLFMPMPDKETVYYDLVPFDTQSQYLLQLDSILNQQGVATINTLGIYNSEKRTAGTLYKQDDTHWNELATKIIGDKITNHPVLKQALKIN